MTAITNIRRKNLVELGKTAAELSRDVGGSYQYWRDLLASEKKSFGEKVARKIEEAYGLTRGHLDQLDVTASAPTNRLKAGPITGGDRGCGLKMTTSLQERVTRAFDYRKTLAATHGRPSKAGLAKAAKVSAGAVGQWFDGHTKSIKGAALLRAANYLGVSPGWLASGVGEMLENKLPADQTQGMTPLHQATMDALAKALQEKRLSDLDCVNLIKSWIE